MSSDNRIHNIRLNASPDKRTIFNDTTVASLGRIELRGVKTTGCVRILARDKVRSGHVDVDGLDIVAADARSEKERPHGYGVYVINGAVHALEHAARYRRGHQRRSRWPLGWPRRRAGSRQRYLLSGGGDKAGRLNVRRLETDAVYSEGGIAPGTPDQITGGVFTVYGAYVDVVRNRRPVVTYGVNDMVLDNWRVVDRWTAEAKITSHGPSGIGFVNFGMLHELKIKAPIETFGQAPVASTSIPARSTLRSSTASSPMRMAPSASTLVSRLAGSSCAVASRRSAAPAHRWSKGW